MEIRHTGNIPGINRNNTDKSQFGSKIIDRGDSFSRGTGDSNRILSLEMARSFTSAKNAPETPVEESVKTKESGNPKQFAESAADSTLNASVTAVSSPVVGAALQKAGEALTPSEQKAYSIIADSSKDEKEAESNFREFKDFLTKDMNPEEMADFYVIGNNFYKKDNKDREYLMRISLKRLHEFIEDKKGKYKDTSRTERSQCLKILLEAIPPGKQHYALNNGDTLRPFYYIKETLNDDKTTTRGAFSFGYDNMETDFSPPSKPDPDIVGAHRMFAKWLNILQHAENRKSPEFKTNDDTNGFHTLRIVRACLNYDPDKTAELEELMGVVGSPWNSLGIIKLLDDVDPAIRSEAKDKTLEEIRKTDMEHKDIAVQARNVAGVYSVMQPGEDYDKTKRRLNEISQNILAHPVWRQRKYNFFAPYKTNLVNQQLKMIGKLREKGESLTDSHQRFKPIFNDMIDAGMDIETFNDFYQMMGEKKTDLMEAIPGTKTYEDVNSETVKIVKEEWLTRSLPVDKAADFINLGLKERKPGQHLKDICKQLAFEFRLMGDFKGLENLDKMVDEGFKNGDFTNVDRKEIIDDIKHNIRFRRMTGENPGEAINKAYQQVKDKRNKKAEEKLKIEKSGDAVIIGGVKLPMRK